jgi:spoIIIJ-associated protein
MNERTTLEIIAATVEAAIAQGLAQLGLTADAVSIEVLDTGNRGLFGLGKPQVRVRLTVNPPKGEAKEVRTGSAVPAALSAATRQSKGEAEAQPVMPPQTPDQSASDQGTESQPEPDPILDRTEAVVSKLLKLLKLEARVSAHYSVLEHEGRPNINVDIRGDDLSVLIGRRSETLGAFQYVASLIVGKETGQFVQLVVDVEGYRNRRERQLIQMAKRVAEQVAKSGRRQTLEPMPSDERRIIHIALRDHPDVKTESTGEDPYRKVMILPKND